MRKKWGRTHGYTSDSSLQHQYYVSCSSSCTTDDQGKATLWFCSGNVTVILSRAQDASGRYTTLPCSSLLLQLAAPLRLFFVHLG